MRGRYATSHYAARVFSLADNREPNRYFRGVLASQVALLAISSRLRSRTHAKPSSSRLLWTGPLAGARRGRTRVRRATRDAPFPDEAPRDDAAGVGRYWFDYGTKTQSCTFRCSTANVSGSPSALLGPAERGCQTHRRHTGATGYVRQDDAAVPSQLLEPRPGDS
jgi:hypothetical protein